VALSEEELDTFRRLETRLGQARKDHLDARRRPVYGLETLDSYYEGLQRVQQLGMAVPPELEQFLVIANWCRTCPDAIEERIDLEGFRLPGREEADKDLWRIWQENELDEESQLAHLDALVFGRSYICVGSGGKGPESGVDEVDRDPATPLVTVESPFEMFHELDPRTRRVKAAVKVYGSGSDKRGTLYLPNATVWLRWGSGEAGRRGWVEEDRDDHNLGLPPVAVLTNRPRVADRYGVSELVDVIPLADAAARALTNAQIATEALAVPQRYVLGATKADFEDPDGNQIPAWEARMGAIWALMNENAKVGQFTAADLANFKTIVDHYATLVAGLKGLPVRYFGQNTANPPSAEGIRADEARIIKTAERRHRAWGGSWELTQRIVRRFIDGDWDPRLKSLETMWRDPATPTKAQAADFAVKLTQGDRPILPIVAAQEELGYGPIKRQKLADQFAAQQADPLIQGLLAKVTPPTPAPAPVVPVPPAA
jgi:hypothetical protein